MRSLNGIGPLEIDSASFSKNANPDVDEVSVNGVYDLTTLNSTSELTFKQSKFHYCSVAGSQIFAELTINSITPPDPANVQVILGFGHGVLGAADHAGGGSDRVSFAERGDDLGALLGAEDVGHVGLLSI